MRIAICDTIDKSIKLKLATSPVNPVQWTSHYFDEVGTDATPVSQDGAISNTTAVTVVDSPIADHIHIIRELSVHNPNAADIKAYLQFINGGGTRITKVWTIPANDSVFLDEKIIEQYFVDGLQWKGDWEAGTYDENDVVKNDGKVWVALTETTEEPTGTPTDWDIMVEDGADGADGTDGTEIELQKTATHIQWRYVGGSWADLVALADITGADGTDGTNGTDGTDGTDGREVEIQNSGTYIQWRYVGEASWTNIVALSALKGDQGDKGDKGDKGDDGVGVPEGGTTGQVLKKKSDTDYDTEWDDESGGGADEKVKYDAGDPTAGYLADKIIAGTGITLEEGTGADENKLKIIGTASYTLPLAGAARGGIKAATKGEGDTVEIKIDGDTEKLYAPAYPSAYSLPLASTRRGGIKAATKGAGDTVECKIDESGEKLYVPTYPTVPTNYWAESDNVVYLNCKFYSLKVDTTNGFSLYASEFINQFGALRCKNTTGFPINSFEKATDATDTQLQVTDIDHSTSETAANGFGVYDEIKLQTSTTAHVAASQDVTKWTTATHATATSIREWWLKGAGAAIARVFAMTGLGQMLLDKYGSGTFTGTVAKWLGVTSAGAVIELTAPDESKLTRTGTKLTPKTANDIVEVTTNDASNPAIKGITSGTLMAGVSGDGGTAGYGVYGEGGVYGGYFKAKTTGNALLTVAAGGIACVIHNTATDASALRITKNTAATNALVPFDVYNLNSTGTAAAGLGIKTSYNIEDAAGNPIEAAYAAVKWSAATEGAVSSVWEWYHYRAGTPELAMSLLATGQLVLPLYTGANFSGTAAKFLADDGSGNVIRVTPPTGGSTDVLMVQIFS